MKKNLFLILTVLFVFSLGVEAKEKAEMSTPQWISNLEFVNRKITETTATAEITFAEAATVTFYVGVGYFDNNGTVYFQIGQHEYSLSTRGEQKIVMTVPKGKIKVEVRTSAAPRVQGARVGILEVNGYARNPYPVVK